jgi:prepilin-type N-terminal cleavage/methylation domain-containing protein
MKTCTARERTGNRAFTLIEVLVVIAIIGILAAIIIPMARIAGTRARINLATAQLSQIETALAQYKDKRGVYPPDNPNNPALNPLFYELTGTVYTEKPLKSTSLFRRIHGGETISQHVVGIVFGLGGFINSSFAANPLDNVQLQQAEVRDFFSELKPKQYLEINPGIQNNLAVILGLVDVDGPLMYGNPTSGKQINPWRYVSSNPANNPSSYDLWVDLVISGKTNRISNWSQEAKPLN